MTMFSMLTLIYTSLVYISCGVESALTNRPESATRAVGDSVEFVCGTDLTLPNGSPVPVHWEFSNSSTSGVPLFTGGYLVEMYEGKLDVDEMIKGHYTLVVQNLTLSDAGSYTCVDDTGIGEDVAVAVLTVVLKKPQGSSRSSGLVDDDAMEMESNSASDGAQSGYTTYIIAGAVSVGVLALMAVLVGLLIHRRRTSQRRLGVSGIAPRNVKVNDVTSNSCVLAWDTPKHYHSLLPQYTVEMRVIDSSVTCNDVVSETIHFVAANDTPTKACQPELRSVSALDWIKVKDTDTTQCTVEGLKERTMYIFRVRILNEGGASEPSVPTEPVFMITKPVGSEYLKNPVQTHTTLGGQPVWGVAFISDSVYLVRGLETREIEIYDIKTVTLQSRMTFKELVTPIDMTSTTSRAALSCLYICDKGYVGEEDTWLVHRVEVKGRRTKWRINDVPTGISLTRDGRNVLVISRGAQKLKEFTTLGSLLRETRLQDDMVNLFQAVQLTNGQFVVSHGEWSDQLNRVCVVGDDGRVRQSYGGQPGSETGLVNSPVYLAVDADDNIIVADSNNQRILLMSSAMNEVRELVSLRDVGHTWNPSRLCLSEDKLFVAVSKWKNGRLISSEVRVFQVKKV